MSHRRIWPVALVLAALLPSVVATSASAARADDRSVRLNQIQVIGTHNSYKRETSELEQDTYDQLIETPGDYDQFLAYSHASIANQFSRQQVRGLELDLFSDPAGGLYAEPLARRRAGLGALPDPAWRQPGIKAFHIADFDYSSTCVRFTDCLRSVRRYSDANPRHVPLMILIELKRSDARGVRLGGVTAPAWDGPALDRLDAEIRSVFGKRDLITPDDVRRGGKTLERSVLSRGWPTLDSARGKVAFLLDNEPGPVRDAYRAGRPNLEGRVLFTNSRPGQADAAFIKRNEPRNLNGVPNTAQIRDLVRQGYLVRTRSDLPLETVFANNPAQLDAALDSGAQLVSTDFPQVGMSARYGSDYVGRMPRGRTFRCNPVNAGRGCRDRRLEPRRDR